MEKNVALALVLGGPHPRPTPLVPYGAVADTIAMVQTEQTKTFFHRHIQEVHRAGRDLMAGLMALTSPDQA